MSEKETVKEVLSTDNALMEMYNLGMKHGIEIGKKEAVLEQLREEVKKLKELRDE